MLDPSRRALVHAVSKTLGRPVRAGPEGGKAVRNALHEMYGLFLAAFRDAAEQLKAGDRSAQFPLGSFPPGLPFVRALPL
jgi:hypothetical protein